MGKSRVAPLKQTTIPRMELTAAVVAVNTDKMLKDELELELFESVFWTDSTTVLRYIDNEGLRFKTFVANRIAVIRESTRPQQWRYVNTSMNPADCASRGLTCEKFMKNMSWIHCPSFLKEPENKWPETNHDLSTKMDDSEVKHLASVNLVCAVDGTDAVNNLINYYSDWYKLKRAVAWILRFKEIIIQRSKTAKDKEVQSCETKPTAENCKALTIKIRAKAVEQKMSELPHDRIMPDQPPFTNVGVDYFGPFEERAGVNHEK
ncbi:uncharacterized protein LOC132158999 [Carassius carassius]|uniref:uncharacterized protein LOC132108322 n=1 Tax=Carassius carassius TaxID=217509 RepID=UPI0028686228|nr:uncharacterized protein LOC132108322 [Carassius carassius]XP_059424626.1 uncharacterized protein LOC132158999 [Carassius carassius]